MIPKSRKNKRPGQNRMESTPFSILLSILFLIILGFLFSSNVKIKQKRTEFDSRLGTLKKEVQILEEKKQKLKAMIFQINEESYLEKEARERFGLKKSGEEVVIFTKEETEPEQLQKEEKGFWQKISDFFSRD